MAAWIPVADCYGKAIDALSAELPSPEGLRVARDNLQKASVQMRNPVYFAVLAKAMVAIGQADEAARTIDHVLQADSQRWLLPEFLRLRAATERAFRLLAWKLRSAHDLAVLLKDRGASAEARQILEPVYDQFTDGFDSGDLRSSRQLLGRLSSSAVPLTSSRAGRRNRN